jgi:hypothetical protein
MSCKTYITIAKSIPITCSVAQLITFAKKKESHEPTSQRRMQDTNTERTDAHMEHGVYMEHTCNLIPIEMKRTRCKRKWSYRTVSNVL